MLSFDIHILNGRFSNDINGEYTCNANDGVSVVDYTAASADLFPYISNFEVLDIDESDHFPITCTLSLKRVQNDSLTPQRYATDSICIQERQKFKWNEIHKIEFQNKTTYLLQIKHEQLTHEIPLDIDKAISTLLSIYYEAGSNMLVRPYKVKSSQPVWWDEDCNEYKQEKYIALRKYRISNTTQDFQEYKFKRNLFKTICRSKKTNYQRLQRQRLINARTNPNCHGHYLNSPGKPVGHITQYLLMIGLYILHCYFTTKTPLV